MDIQEEREAFEDKFPIPAHWIDFDGLTCKYICKYNAVDDQALKYQARWEAWLAAKAQAVPEEFILVPIKLPEDAIYSLVRKRFEKGQSLWNKFGQFSESNKERWIQSEMNIIKNLYIDFLRTFESL